MARAFALAAMALVVAVPSGSAAAAPSCARTVTGGLAPERAAVGRMLCLMPGTRIQGVEIGRPPADAPSDTIALRILVIPPRSNPRQAGALIETKLQRLGRRYAVGVELERFNPFGKAPVVTVTSARPGEYLRGPALPAFKRALRFGAARYDGALLLLVSRGRPLFAAFDTARAFVSVGCAGFARVQNMGKACPLS